jgi:uncharacterized cupin superfamily protein
MTKPSRPILNLDQAPFSTWKHGSSFEADISWLGQAMGSRKLGFNVAIVPPGKRVFPYHQHSAQEELFFILEGRGSIRLGARTLPIRQGDFISIPPGPGSAHQIINDSEAPLRYLAVSTMEVPEVAEYPDIGKIGVFTGTPPGKAPAEGSMRHFTYLDRGASYWDGED